LSKNQRPDLSWVPLWFGNEHVSSEENLTYGTSRVLLALVELWREGFDVAKQLAGGVRCLLSAQNNDGGWGGEGIVLHRWKKARWPSKPSRSVQEFVLTIYHWT
ncbi:MAG: hypothetical protein ABIQ35_15045, partial [Verrucomicrobiota bacterium]